MAITYEPIATNTISGSPASSVTFSSIVGSYTDLILIAEITGVSGGSLRIQFNGDTATNYSITRLGGNGSTASSNRTTNQTYLNANWSVGYDNADPQFTKIDIMNYSNSTTFKTMLARTGKGTNAVDSIVGTWRSTSAITQITCIAATANFNEGSTFTLYGIAKA